MWSCFFFSTKEIKPSGPFIRSVYKKVNKNGILSTKVSSTLSQSSWSSLGSHHGNHHSNSGSLASHNGVSSHNGSSAFSNNQRVPSPQAFSGFSQSANNGRRGPAHEPLRWVVLKVFFFFFFFLRGLFLFIFFGIFLFFCQSARCSWAGKCVETSSSKLAFFFFFSFLLAVD